MSRNENDGRVCRIAKGLVANADLALARDVDEEFWRGIHFLGSLGSGVLCVVVGCGLWRGAVLLTWLISADLADLMQPTPFFQLLIIKKFGQSLSNMKTKVGGGNANGMNGSCYGSDRQKTVHKVNHRLPCSYKGLQSCLWQPFRFLYHRQSELP